MPFVNCNKFNTSQALQDQAIADLAQELLTKQNALKDCSGNPLAGNVPTCAQMTTAIQNAVDALPADKFLKGLQSYNPATNTMTLLMSDGSTVDVDMTALLADAVSGGAAPTGAAGGDLQGTYPNPTVVPASTTQAGKVELATNAEATAGTSTTLAVTPAGLKAAIDAAPDSDAQTLSVGASGISISNGNTIDAISNDNGNLLQWRADGAYYGIEAAPNTSNLYFDPVSGNNANAGTKASPLKTMDEGFRRNNIGTGWTAWLAEGKTHEMRSSWGNFAGQSVTMRPYGSNYDAVYVNNPPSSVSWTRSAEITGARVKWISDKQASDGSEDARSISSTGNTPTYTITSFAITHDTTDVAEHPISSFAFSFVNGLNIRLLIVGGGFVTGNSFYFANAKNSNLSARLSNVLVDSSNGTRLIMLDNTVNSIFVEQEGGAPGTVIPGSNGALTWRKSSTKAEVLALVAGQTGIITGNLTTN